jgi:RNase P/RNase MRP subunit POP5
MLKRRYKRRYIGIVSQELVADPDWRALFRLVQERNSELFGYVFNELAKVKLVSQEQGGLTIISCRANSLDQLLVSLTFMDPPLLIIDVSGSINKLKKRCTLELASLYYGDNSANS